MVNSQRYPRFKDQEGSVTLPDLLPAWICPESRRYLQSRGLSEEEADFYDLGFVQSGYWKNRLIIPFYEEEGLVGFQGRLIVPGEPKYETRGRRPLYIPWGEESIGILIHDLLIVEGAFDLFAARRAFSPTIATLGTGVSPRQFSSLLALIHQYGFQRVLIWFDHDPAGFSGAFGLQLQLQPHLHTEVILNDTVTDPGDATPEQIQDILSAQSP